MSEGEKNKKPSYDNFDAPVVERPRTNFLGTRHYRPSDEDRYNAATNLANDPNTPDFFSDAVMANTAVPQPRKSHKWLIIGISIAAVLIIGIIVVSVILSKRTDTQFGTKNISEAFNLFGNYMLTGTESIDALPESIDVNSYTSYRIGYMDSSNNAAEKEQYFSKLYEYYEILKKYYDEADKTKYNLDIVSDDSIKYLGDAVDFFRNIDAADEKTNGNIYVYYSNNGQESTKRYIENIYGPYSSSENVVMSGYFSVKRLAAEEMLNLAYYTNKAKCLEAKNIEKCLIESDRKLYNSALESREKIKNYQSSMVEYRNDISITVLTRTIEMSNEIKRAEGNK